MKPLIYCTFLLSIFFVSCVKEDVEEPVCCPSPQPEPEPKTETYTVTFTFDWNRTDFPTDYPSGPHFSRLVGWVHQTEDTFFKEGKTATNGIEQMAENGVTSTLVAELEAFVKNGKGLKTYTGSGLSGGVGTISIDVEVTTDFPAVSLATMLAPSPDWYVACVAVNLLDSNNQFVAKKTVVGHVYDAGTDSGTTFTSTNADINPRIPIAKITQPPLGDGNEVKPSLCSVTFTKK